MDQGGKSSLKGAFGSGLAFGLAIVFFQNCATDFEPPSKEKQARVLDTAADSSICKKEESGSRLADASCLKRDLRSPSSLQK